MPAPPAAAHWLEKSERGTSASASASASLWSQFHRSQAPKLDMEKPTQVPKETSPEGQGPLEGSSWSTPNTWSVWMIWNLNHLDTWLLPGSSSGCLWQRLQSGALIAAGPVVQWCVPQKKASLCSSRELRDTNDPGPLMKPHNTLQKGPPDPVYITKMLHIEQSCALIAGGYVGWKVMHIWGNYITATTSQHEKQCRFEAILHGLKRVRRQSDQLLCSL